MENATIYFIAGIIILITGLFLWWLYKYNLAYFITTVIILIISIALWWHKQVKFNKDNPIFYRKGKDAKKDWKIPSSEMYKLESGPLKQHLRYLNILYLYIWKKRFRNKRRFITIT